MTEQPEQYDPMLVQMKELGVPMLCANPDIVVESGDRLVPCAGALAARYEAIGGSAMIVGKPNAPIYDRAMVEIRALLADQPATSRVLAIGDGARTDILGANRAGLAALFIASGIHAEEYGDDSQTKAADVAAFLDRNEAVANYFMPRLCW
jgi:HAD superfamily hydrolase (TIGR01450 family)